MNDFRSFSKDSKDLSDLYDDEFNEKLDKDLLEEPPPPENMNRGYRRDGRQGPIPTFRAYSSEEVQQREASHRMYYLIQDLQLYSQTSLYCQPHIMSTYHLVRWITQKQ